MKIHHLLVESTRKEMEKITHVLGNHLRRTSHKHQTAHEPTHSKLYLDKLIAK